MNILGPFSASTNFAVDILGTPDTRPGTWGDQGVAQNITQFNPPSGYGTRILRVYGDFIAWPKGFVPTQYPATSPTEAYYAGVLWGLTTTAPGGSTRMVPGADDCMIYLQQGVRLDPVRAPFDSDVHLGGLLQPDNKLVSTMAVWLNTLGIPLHLEATFVCCYQWEKA
jgi:hypothetical protein